MTDRSVVHLVDPDQSACRQWEGVLSRAGHAVRSYDSPAAFLADGISLHPACVVTELAFATMTGHELQARVAQIDPTVAIVFASGNGDVRQIVRVMRAGAVDFLQKPVAEAALIDAVDRAVRRSEELRAVALQRTSAKERLGRLTPRERTILVHVLEGRLNKQIAAVLDCQEATVKVHRSRLMRKLGVRSVARLVQLAEDFGMGGASRTLNAYRDDSPDRALHAG